MPKVLDGIMDQEVRCEFMDADTKQIKSYLREHAISK